MFALVWNQYLATTPQRIRLLDIFLGFLITVGVLQFVYCVIGGNYVSDRALDDGRPREQWVDRRSKESY